MLKFRISACILLLCLLLTPIASAASIPFFNKNEVSTVLSTTTTLDTTVIVSPEITAEQAAQRLYFLGLMGGTGMKDGAVNFALSRSLTRLEAVVMLARLLGVEGEILATASEQHPIPDVSGWGNPYVGYFVHLGIIQLASDGSFNPSGTVSTADFMQYMLYALGYMPDGGEYELNEAGQHGIRAGITSAETDVITRGEAVRIMYRTLNATYNGSGLLLSQKLVNSGVINYQDAMFLLWTENRELTDAYIATRGYSTEKILPDGKYTLSLSDGRAMNVAVTAANRDYDGATVNVNRNIGNVMQQFRVVRSEEGTYKIYSCASNGGYNRALGFNIYGTAGIYSTRSKYIGEFYIRYSDRDNGTWLIIPASDTSRILGTTRAGATTRTALLLCDPADETKEIYWNFSFEGIVDDAGREIAIYPSDTVNITQGAYDRYSHQKQNAVDFTTPNGNAYAPFTGKIVRIDRSWSRWNTVWLESCDPVVYADGTVDYMTVVFMHDNNVSDLSVGQIVGQGEYFYQMGVAGGATGPHIHIAIIRGKYKSNMGLTGSGNVYLEDALFLPASTTISYGYGLDWVILE